MKNISFILSICFLLFTFSSKAQNNIDFESGNLGSWDISGAKNISSVPFQTCCAVPCNTAIIGSFAIDPYMSFPINSPFGGNWAVRLNTTTLTGQQESTISRTIAVTASNNYLKIAAKYVLEKAGHTCSVQPFVSIKVTDVANTFTVLNKFISSNEGSTCAVPNFFAQTTATVASSVFYYSNSWDTYCLDLTPYIGNTINIELIASECSYGDHRGYAYFDLKNPGFIPSGNSFTLNSNTYSLTSTSLNVKECTSNTAIAIAPLAAASNTWYGTNINGSNASSVQINQAGSYTLVSNLMNNSGCNNWLTNSTVYFTVGIIPPISVSVPTSICNYNGVTFTLSGASHYAIVSSYSGGTLNTTSSMATMYPPGTYTANTISTYSVTGYSSLGCSSTSTFNVTSYTIPIITISGNSLCANTAATLMASGADTFTWVVGSTTVANTNSLSVPTPSYASINIYGTNTISGCSSYIGFNTWPQSATLAVSPAPIICSGKSIMLNTNGSGPIGSYTWDPGSTVANNTIVLSQTVTTTYTVSSLNACGLVTTAITLTVNPLPIASISGPTLICPNTIYNYTASGSAFNYTFTGMGSYTGPNNTIIAAAAPTPTNNVISVFVMSNSGCIGSNSLNISILPQPSTSITVLPNQIICQSTTATISIPSGASTYSWTSGSTTYSTAVSPTVNTYYQVWVTGTNGCSLTTGQWITVINSVPSLSMVGSSYTVCQGSGINFSSLPCCGQTYSIDNVSYSTYIGTYTPSTSGIHTISAQNACGVISTTFNVLINPTPIVSIIVADTNICKGNAFTFTLTGGADKYQVYRPFAPSFTTANSVNTTSMSITGYLSVIGTYTATGCASTYTFVHINAIPNPTLYISSFPSMNICPGSTVNLIAGGGPVVGSYTWSTGPISNTVNVLVPSTTIISVAGTGTNGCLGWGSKTLTPIAPPTITFTPISPTVCLGSNVNIVASGITTYTWSNSTNNSNIWVTPTVSTIYTVQGHYTSTNNPCPGTGTILVNVLPLPPIGFTAPLYTICAGQTAVITATGANAYYYPAFNYSSSVLTLPNQNFGQTINVIGTGTNGCQKTTTVQLTVFPNPILSIVTTPTGGCQGTNFTLTANGASTYSWNTSALIPSIVVSPTASSNYSVVGTSSAGCTNSVSQIVVIYGPYLVISSSTNNICSGSNATLSVSGASSYTWSTLSNNAIITVTPSTNTTYTVLGSNSICTNTAMISVSVSPIPTITISGSTILCYGASDILTANGATSYTWVSGPLTNTYFVTPPVSSTYTVIGSGPNGCSSSANHSISVYTYTNVTISAPNSLCIGQSATLTALGANTYSWISGPQTDTYVVTPSANTIYTVNAITSGSCLASATKSISVYNYPNITVNTNTNNICAGQPATLTANGAATYTWSNNTFNASTVVYPPAPITYTVTGANAVGCSVTQTININAIPSPTVNVSTTHSILCIGQLATITAVGATTYSWNNFSFNYFFVTSPTVNTTYTVTGTNPNGCYDMEVITQSVSACTGIMNSNGDGYSILIYPNPVNDVFNVKLNSFSENTTLKVYTALGQLLFIQKINSNITSIDMSKYAKGVYYIKISEGKKEENFKIIKE